MDGTLVTGHVELLEVALLPAITVKLVGLRHQIELSGALADIAERRTSGLDTFQSHHIHAFVRKHPLVAFTVFVDAVNAVALQRMTVGGIVLHAIGPGLERPSVDAEHFSTAGREPRHAFGKHLVGIYGQGLPEGSLQRSQHVDESLLLLVEEE